MAISWVTELLTNGHQLATELLTNGIQLGYEAADQWPSVGLQSC